MFSFSMLLPLSTGSGTTTVFIVEGPKIDCFLLSTIVDIIWPTPWIDLRTFFPGRASKFSQSRNWFEIENIYSMSLEGKKMALFLQWFPVFFPLIKLFLCIFIKLSHANSYRMSAKLYTGCRSQSQCYCCNYYMPAWICQDYILQCRLTFLLNCVFSK